MDCTVKSVSIFYIMQTSSTYTFFHIAWSYFIRLEKVIDFWKQVIFHTLKNTKAIEEASV